VQGCHGDIVWLFPENMSNPFPTSFGNYCGHILRILTNLLKRVIWPSVCKFMSDACGVREDVEDKLRNVHVVV
jgi:hypothetical protein